jgi:hypothetical protein
MTLGNSRLPHHTDRPNATISHLKSHGLGSHIPDDETVVTILTICELMKQSGNGVNTAVEAYERAMKDVIR